MAGREQEEHLRVLVADESKRALEPVGDALRELGHEVIALAVELEETARATHEHRPDLAIVALHEDKEHALELIEQIVTIYHNYGYDTKVLVASVRHPVHIVQAGMLGADVATIPFKVLEQLYKHPLTDAGLDRFLADWKKTGKSFDE